MSSAATAFRPAIRFQNETTNVWSIFTPLANKHAAVNLGQGFPNFPVSQYLKDAAATAVNIDALNQYSPVYGLPRLRQAISKSFEPLFGRTIDPNTDVMICQGATEGTFALFQSILNPGDEVILFEPAYDMYVPSITLAGAVPVYVPLRRTVSNKETCDGSGWKLDVNELRGKITSRTRVILFNTPHNPIGKVFSRNELIEIADIAKEFDLIVASDEVYDRLLYDNVEHARIATLPGMWDRTVTIGSAGKTFSVTGWKVGWLIGPAHLISATILSHQRIAFCVATPLQEAVAVGFEDEQKHNFFYEQQQSLHRKRQILLDGLDELHIPYTRPQGAYFILFNTESFSVDSAITEPRDWAVCRALTSEVGVAAIPPSAFYSAEHVSLAQYYARFCFCKTEETLVEGVNRLRQRLPKLLNTSS